MLETTNGNDRLKDLVRQAAEEQDVIGRSNFLRGRITKRWRIAQHQYLQNCKLLRKKSSKAWGSNFLIHVYELIYVQWEHRNGVIAKSTREKASASERNKIACDIRKQFELGIGTLRPNDHHCLANGIDKVLKRNIRSQKYWVRKCIVSREYTENSEKNMLIGMRSIMRTWALAPD